MTFLRYNFKVFSFLLRREIFLAFKAPSVDKVQFTLNEQFPRGQETTVTGTLIIRLNITASFNFFEEAYNFMEKYGRNKKEKERRGMKGYSVAKLVELFIV